MPFLWMLTSVIGSAAFMAWATVWLRFSPAGVCALVGLIVLGAAYDSTLVIRQVLSRWRILIKDGHATIETQILSAGWKTVAQLPDIDGVGIDHYRTQGFVQIAPRYYLRLKRGEKSFRILTGFPADQLESVRSLLQPLVRPGQSGALPD